MKDHHDREFVARDVLCGMFERADRHCGDVHLLECRVIGLVVKIAARCVDAPPIT
ncbi:hypothetical protein O7A70_06360 [Mesorhizobium sp. Cs1299R1N1]|uniref:hypothetical protein n=1 Tax=Mesorhizobium sp. Cs1299R1N1 TaxID=3015172 RepID=UPI00301E3E74